MFDTSVKESNFRLILLNQMTKITFHSEQFRICQIFVFWNRDLFNISYSRELYLFSKFLHFEEIVRVKIAVHFEIIVIEAYTTF